jgi:hypothetical protein
MHIFSRILRAGPGFVLGIPLSLIIAVVLCGCKGSKPSGPSGDGGSGGEGGCPVNLPEPQFVVEITAEDGTLPADTRVGAEWSAANEPPFVLSDPATWKTLDDSVNLFCIIDRNKPPPEDLPLLVCELWTSGAVNLFVEGTGYTKHEETLKPTMNELCGGPMSAKISVVLHRPLLDAGPVP